MGVLSILMISDKLCSDMFPSISDGVCQALKELRESKNTADIKSVVSADLQQAVLSENCVPFF